MMTDDEAWRIEESLWTGGAAAYDRVLSEACVMTFPAPAGIMTAPVIREGIRSAPRWAGVAMAERTVGRPDDGTIVLAYRAEGRRPGADPYRAWCSSTWRLIGGRWLIVQHQQTPVA